MSQDGKARHQSALRNGRRRYAVHEHLVRPDAADEEVVVLTRKLTPGLAGYVAMIVVGIFVPVAAVLGYLVIAVFYLIPFHSIRRQRRERPAA